MKHTSLQKGYSLVEVLVAVSILMLSIVGPLTIAAKSLQSAQYVRQQNTAFFLAQEGITAINTIRNDAGLAYFDEVVSNPGADPWSWISDPALDVCVIDDGDVGCNMTFDADPNVSLQDTAVDCSTDACTMLFDEDAQGERSVYQLTSGNESPYTRIITLEPSLTNPDAEVLVTSRVEWESSLLGSAQSVVLSTSLFNLYE